MPPKFSNAGISLAGRHERVTDFSAIKAAGFSWVRLNLRLPLDDMEIRVAESALAQGCSLLMVLPLEPNPTSSWRSSLRDALQRFSHDIHHWEVGSEPDDPAFGWPQDQLQTYANSFRRAAAEIKTIDPQACIHNGGLGRSLPKGILQLCELGCDSLIDVWNVHPYLNPLMPDALGGLRYFQDRIQKTLSTCGQAKKPLWWSSIACPGMKDATLAKNWWLGKNPNEQVQADWAKVLFSQAPTWGVEHVFWEGWQDQPGQTSTGIDYFGLLRSDGSPKPAHDAIARPLLV